MNRKVLIAAAIFALALAVRFLYLREHTDSPFSMCPVLDEMYLDNMGQDIATGQPLSGDASFRAPLYPALLGAVYSLGLDGRRFFNIQLLQHLLGALTCVAVFALGWSVFNRRAGIAAGVLAALYGPLIFYEGEILIVTLFTFLNALALALLAAGEKQRRWWLLACGALALGLAIISRPNILPFALLVPVWVLVFPVRCRFRERMLRLLAVALPIMLVVGAVAVKNKVVGGDFVLVSSQGGVNLWYGNGPHARGLPPPNKKAYSTPQRYADGIEKISQSIAPEAPSATVVERRPLRPSEISALWRQKTLDYVRANPGRWLRLVFRKCLLFIGNYEIPNCNNYRFCLRYSLLLRLLPLGFGMILALSACGLALGGRGAQRSGLVLLLLYVAAFSGAIVLFFVCARLRLPVVAGLLPLAGAGVDGLVRAVKRKLLLLIAAAVVAVVAVASFVDWYGVKALDYSEDFWVAGKCNYDQGRYKEAASDFARSIETEDPFFAGAHLYLGYSLLNMKEAQPLAAKACFENILTKEPDNSIALTALGYVYQEGGDPEMATSFYMRAVEVAPGNAKARTNLGLMYLRRGRSDDAAVQLLEALKTFQDDPETHLGLAVCALLAGNEDVSRAHRATAISLGGEEYVAHFEELREAALSRSRPSRTP